MLHVDTTGDRLAYSLDAGIHSTALSLFYTSNMPVILFTLALILTGVAIYLSVTPNSYTAQALLIIDSRKQPFQQQSFVGERVD